MPLLRLESFDHWATADAPKKGWEFGSGGSAYIDVMAGAGRNGTKGMRHNNNFHLARCQVTNTLRTGIVGFALRFSYMPSGNAAVFRVLENSGEHLQLFINATGTVAVRSPDTGAFYISTLTLTAATWHFIEFAWTINNAPSGAVEVRVNGTPYVAVTGVDTQNGGTGVWSGFAFAGSSNENAGSALGTFFDDIYIANDNTFRGDHRIVCVLPSTGNGAHVGWTPSAGTDHGSLVDEAAPNTTDFIQSGSVGAIDTFNFPAIGLTGSVAGVQFSHYAKAEVAGTRTIGNVCRIGGADYVLNDPVQLGPDWDYRMFVYPASPAPPNDPWTVAEIDAAEFGVKVVA